MTIEELAKENGHFSYDGKKFVLLQQAYITGPVDGPYYEASAIAPEDGLDEYGLYPVYLTTWYPLQSWLDGDQEDEGDACDWDSPDDVNEIMSGYNPDKGYIV